MRNYPNFLKAFMEYCSYVEAPKEFLRWSALSTIAGALERKVWLTNGAATWYPNLYVFLVGEPGCRKSTSSEFAMDLLRELPDITFLADRLNEASFIVRLKSAGFKHQFEYHGESYKHSAAFLYASEAATAFSEMHHNGGIIVALTDLYNGGPRGWHLTHAWTKHTMKDGETQIFNPCINLLACSTQHWLTSKVMTQSDVEGGFGSRVILVVHKGSYRTNFKFTQANEKEATMRKALVEDLKHINKLQGAFSYDKAFADTMEAFDELHAKSMTEGPQLLGAYKARKMTHAIKVAQILSVSRSDDLMLRSDDLIEAWTYLDELEPNMIDIFNRPSNSPFEERNREILKNKNEVLELIKSFGDRRFMKSEVSRHFIHTKNNAQVTQSLKELLDSGLLDAGYDPSTATAYYQLKANVKNP